MISDNQRYHNYHKHDHFGNVVVLDTIAKPEDYCKRAIELGHDTVFTTNHGYQGFLPEMLETAKKYGLKAILGVESYYVPDRKAEDCDGKKDRSNRHIVIIALNDDGIRQINEIISEAFVSGYYCRPRIDEELLFSLNPDNVIVTTGCVAGIWHDATDYDLMDTELLLMCQRHFGSNFYLEVQCHDEEVQKQANRKLLEFSELTGIPIIHGNDSHYCYPEDKVYREKFLRAKRGKFETNSTDEVKYDSDNSQHDDNFMLDYPSAGEIVRRYREQGVLTDAQIEQAILNTLVFDKCAEITIMDKSIKLPSVSPDPYNELESLVWGAWEKEKQYIQESMWPTYVEAIKSELQTVHDTHMENYFILDYRVVKRAQEVYNGKLTNTGRGSAPSFYIVKLLGLTDIDRIASPITLFPSRFMSTARILGTKSLPDIDLNSPNAEPFIQATKDLLGEENCAWMVSYKPLQRSSAFRLWCKAEGLHISEYDDVAKDLDRYTDDKRWKKLIEDSQRFVGVIESISESPCSMLLYDKPLNREVGLIRLTSKNSKNKICCLMNGLQCDIWKYLKNDYLTVKVWTLIRNTCELIGIPIPTIRELNALLDDKTYQIYEDGLTCTINQADSDNATPIAMTYKPKSVSDLSAFVAIIRPGCKSLLNGFIHREPYTTGVLALDALLEDSQHRLIYQESLMKYFIWLGIPETGSYDIIKKIAKKKFKEHELAELKEKLLAGWIANVGTDDGFESTWIIVEQAANYSFNSSHSLAYAYDSLYGAYLKSHYPLEYYTVAFDNYDDDMVRTAKLTGELKRFGIELKPIKFRYSRAGYACDKETNSIYKGVGSIKEMNKSVGEYLYSLRDKQFTSFFDFLFFCKEERQVKDNQLKILIKLGFFSEFGEVNELLWFKLLFDRFWDKTNLSKDSFIDFGIDLSFPRKCCEKETAKQFRCFNSRKFFELVSLEHFVVPASLNQIVKWQIDYLGYCDIVDERYKSLAVVMELDTKYSPKVVLYSLKNGTTLQCKIDKKSFNRKTFEPGDILVIRSTKRKQKMQKTDNGFEPVIGAFEYWITNYGVYNGS